LLRVADRRIVPYIAPYIAICSFAGQRSLS